MKKHISIAIIIGVIVVACAFVTVALVHRNKIDKAQQSQTEESTEEVGDEEVETFDASEITKEGDPRLYTIEGRKELFGSDEDEEEQVNEPVTLPDNSESRPVVVDNYYDFGDGVQTWDFVLDEVPSFEEIKAVAEWCKSRGISGTLYYYSTAEQILEDYDPTINLDRCYTCSVVTDTDAYDYVIFINDDGEPEQYYYTGE